MKIIFEKIECKLWLLGSLHIRYPDFPQNFLPKLYRSDAKDVSLHSNINYLNQVKLLASSAINLSLAGFVLEESGQHILLENFIEYFPMLEKFCIYWNDKNIPPCKNYEKVLTSLQKFPAFRELMFYNLPDNFNIHTFLHCVKHIKIQFKTKLAFMNESSEAEVENRLEEIVDELNKTKNFDYCPTLIWSYTLRKLKLRKYAPLESKIDQYLKHKRLNL
uniref:Uncharacterized protein n=1 Tax=Panagrolaimus superbus TaxID=310955 RepID=A0A914YRA3_9BILA